MQLTIETDSLEVYPYKILECSIDLGDLSEYKSSFITHSKGNAKIFIYSPI